MTIAERVELFLALWCLLNVYGVAYLLVGLVVDHLWDPPPLYAVLGDVLPKSWLK